MLNTSYLKLTREGGSEVKNPAVNAGDVRHGFDPWVKKILWRRKRQLTLVFLPGKSHGQRDLVGYIHGIGKSWTRLSD